MCINFQLNNAWNTNAKHVQICAHSTEKQRKRERKTQTNIRRNKYLIASRCLSLLSYSLLHLPSQVSSSLRHCVTRFRFRLVAEGKRRWNNVVCSLPWLPAHSSQLFICVYLFSVFGCCLCPQNPRFPFPLLSCFSRQLQFPPQRKEKLQWVCNCFSFC